MVVHEKLMMIQATLKVPKDKWSNFGKYYYRSAEEICESIKPLLKEHKCAMTISDDIMEIGGRFYIKATVELTDLESGTSVKTTALAREAVEKKGMDESQVTGAASSYARKYALSGLLLLDDNKDADTDEYKEEVPQTPKFATTKEKEELEQMCAKHKVNLTKWLACNNVGLDTLTSKEANAMIQAVLAKHGGK